MEIQTIKNGNTKLIAYADGGDNRILQSTEMPAPEWNHAWENLALDYKCILAKELGVNSAKMDGFIQDHIIRFNKIHFKYKDGEETPHSYEIWGHHSVGNTGYDTDIHLSFTFGNENSPDKAALSLRKAGEDYAMNKRGEVDMFEQDTPEETAGSTEEG